ncbi:MAG TPA: hypothetical protein VIV60_12240 [Polyangiaceae bacterium]
MAGGTFGCNDQVINTGEGEETGSVTLAVTSIPASVLCLQVVAAGAGRTEYRNIDLTRGTNTVSELLTGLPIGEVKFTGSAYKVGCDQVVPNTNAEYISAPVSVYLTTTHSTNVTLSMMFNGKATIGADWEEAITAPNCTPVNIAVDASIAASDPGWGGGSNAVEVIDGVTCYSDWSHGLAFTGGINQYAGVACGSRQLTLDFGRDRQLTGKIDIYHHGPEHIPNTAKIEVLVNGAWLEAFSTTNEKSYIVADTCPVSSVLITHDIGPIVASQVRYSINNCDIEHGWIYEAVVEGCSD